MLVNIHKFFFFKVVMKQIQLFAFIMGKTSYKVLIMMRYASDMNTFPLYLIVFIYSKGVDNNHAFFGASYAS